jgi:hypothetical protein
MEVSGEPFYSQVPNEYKAGWVLEPVWTFWTTKRWNHGPVVQPAVYLTYQLS